MAVNPPLYQWNATTAQEAETSLKAARSLIDAHLMTLAPGSAYITHETRCETPLTLRISLDLGPVIAAINAADQPDEQAAPGDVASDS
ncbi:hypothetical protein [Streptomyces sp. NBC_01264]|uniref:hypothetical protein n=1 Tax=Streptomyces sp. NBC_01264 TaxID=2903804 RepID=UPI002254083C|nr:hypothetical protein [Streptomyces sp. NBC_01264]MCX4784028.1 hypothetical protein [Streptomyces sp. NBC_01264]